MSKTIDLCGKKFGKWTVVDRDTSKKYRNPQWICECSCGKRASVTGVNLKSGGSVQCKACSGNAPLQLTGKIFGNWTVLAKSKIPRKWLCECSCGTKYEVLGYHLLSGASKQCRNCYGKQPLNIPIGTKNNKWTLVKTFIKNGSTQCKCQCECGRFYTLSAYAFTSGSSRQCKKCANWKGFGEISATYWGRLIRGAHKRNLDFNLTIEYAWNLFLKQDRKCKLSDLNLSFIRNDKYPASQTASLDRIDSSKGYIVGNVQWIHKDINFMKQDYDQKYFISICKMIAGNN